MDVRMPVMDGLEATRQILGPFTDERRPKVLILTTFDLDEYVYEALSAGASAFSSRTPRGRNWSAGFASSLPVTRLLAPSITRRLIADFAYQRRPNGPLPVTLGLLTPREVEVLRLIARGLSNAEISETLVVAPQTTKTHVGRILMKLGLHDRTQAVVVAYESGLVVPNE